MESWSQIPESARNKLNKNTEIVFGRRLSDYDPELAKKHPRGWPKGMTWASSDGFYSPSKNKIAVFKEKRIPVSRRYHKSEPERLDYVLKHETGHAFDKRKKRQVTSTKGFYKAYKKDIEKLSEDKKELPGYAYQLQKSPAGEEEAFANAFAYVSGADMFQAGYSGKSFENDWKNIIKFVKGKMK
jgi:hypothetical protein